MTYRKGYAMALPYRTKSIFLIDIWLLLARVVGIGTAIKPGDMSSMRPYLGQVSPMWTPL